MKIQDSWRSKLTLGICCLWLVCCSFGQSADGKVSNKKDTRVDPTHWGNVEGRIYDATTGAPIVGATVSGYTEDGFLDKGRSVGKTEALGRYRLQLILGRISHNFDVGRALMSSAIGILMGTATNTTKRLDVSRVGLQVKANGYKPFEGVVTARYVVAEKFTIYMQPVLLMPDNTDGSSVAATGWNAIRIVQVSASPDIAQKGQTVTVSATLKLFTKEVSKNTEVCAFSSLWKGSKKLKRVAEPNDQGEVTFSTEYKVSGKEKQSANRVLFAVTKSDLDFDRENSIRNAVIQITRTKEDEDAAKIRLSVISAMREEHYDEALSICSTLAQDNQAQDFDVKLYADLASRQGKYEETISPLNRLWLSSPRDLVLLESYAESLDRAKKDSDLIATLSTIIKGVKSKDLKKKATSGTLAYLGNAYVRTGDLESAAKLNEALLDVENSGLDESVIGFRGKLRLAQVERDHKADPSSVAALADYGRALLDLGRIDEAIPKLSDAVQLDSGRIDYQKDLAWAVLQMHGKDKAPEVDLQKAADSALSKLNVGDKKQRSKDFSSWNQYGILLFALADQQESAGDPKAAETFEKSIEALREALSLGRVGAKVNPGVFGGYQYGYWSGREVNISGFAYPQANSTFLLLDALKRLKKSKDDRIALFNASTALFDLGQTKLSKAYLERFTKLDPQFADGGFLQALIAHRQGDDETAIQLLSSVIAIAPNHPRANLVMADILVESGDMPSSSASLAAHAKYYGDIKR